MTLDSSYINPLNSANLTKNLIDELKGIYQEEVKDLKPALIKDKLFTGVFEPNNLSKGGASDLPGSGLGLLNPNEHKIDGTT